MVNTPESLLPIVGSSLDGMDKPKGITRHCGFCLKVCGIPAKLCGGCKKRAYCSTECQKADWSKTGKGQRHVMWCGKFECGEEDVEWEVVPIPNKGLGIRAKKHMPALYRIMVEPVYFNVHDAPKAIQELGPDGASLKTKFESNALFNNKLKGFGKEEDKHRLGLRIARMNHSCRPNAATIYDEVACVEIVFAQHDILPGEEICITYCTLSKIEGPTADMSLERHLNYVEKKLTSRGITCPSDCHCKDPAVHKLIMEEKKVNDQISAFAVKGRTEDALATAEKLIDIHKRLDVAPWFQSARTLFGMHGMAAGRQRTLAKGDEYNQETLKIFGTICPYSERTKRCKLVVRNREATPFYLLAERIEKNPDEKCIVIPILGNPLYQL